MTTLNHTFAAMGTSVQLLLDCPDTTAGEAALQAGEAKVHELARTFSRFDSSSELTQLNTAGSLRCSPELFEVIALALTAREDTGGRFDPTVGVALEACGYNRTFAEVVNARPQTSTPAACSGDVTLDPATRTVTLGPGVQLDLGGIAKGWIADAVLAELSAVGPALVNAGGDIASSARLNEPWTVSLPGADDEALAFSWGAVATSGTDRRRWIAADGSTQHHVIDPSSGRPSATDMLQVTVFAPTCAEAEVQATRLLLAGTIERASVEAQELDIAAVLVEPNGTRHNAGALA